MNDNEIAIQFLEGESERKMGHPIKCNPYGRTAQVKEHRDWNKGWCDYDMILSQGARKRRPERKRIANETPITFLNIDNQIKAQLILRQNNIKIRVSGLSLYVADGLRMQVQDILKNAGISVVPKDYRLAWSGTPSSNDYKD